ncbi:hypothetical protein B1987_18705 [Mycobacterium kansasii]|uniref:Uncharacterized protein n=1 Tax=Mycobacterium attenuatum TaxID=2341086 RepID=A0A498Q1I7_9MYCO|nr:hypothetical protein [Mycobacterium attenuatum]ORB85482.1 hypothetical protein B1987_18705 [Mycobacterium kansasii]VBA38764.1 hypothetical protein LAUMK136_02638 [Mycobacterium attenuatum]
MVKSDERTRCLELFGADGPLIRDQIPDLFANLHARMADAQEVSGQISRGVYGQIWRGAFEELQKAFGHLQGATMFTPQGANYRVVMVNGVAIFAWRYSLGHASSADTARFATSGARLALFEQTRPELPQQFDFGIERSHLIDEDVEILNSRAANLAQVLADAKSTVVIAYASSVDGLHSLEWGLVSHIDKRGYLHWGDFHEKLNMGEGELVVVGIHEPGDFASGEVPSRVVKLRETESCDA